MAAIIIIFTVLVFYHYFIENVVVPTRQLELEEKLIGTAVKYKKLERSRSTTLNESSFRELQKMVVTSLVFIPEFNFLEFWGEYRKMRKEKNSQKYQEKERFIKEIEENKNADLRTTFGNYQLLLKQIFASNMIGWTLYLFPIIVPITVIVKMRHKNINPFKRLMGLKRGTEVIVSTKVSYEHTLKRKQLKEKTLDPYERNALSFDSKRLEPLGVEC